MICRLRGYIVERASNYCVLETGGVGYKVFVGSRALASLPSQEEIVLHIHTHNTDTEISLYGFESLGELQLFEQLLSVSGVGPRSALSILEVAEPDRIVSAISSGRSDLLATASGVGAKTAARIIVELKGKVFAEGAQSVVSVMEADADVVEALVSLGYSREAARLALQSVPADHQTVESRLKAALQMLSRKGK